MQKWAIVAYGVFCAVTVAQAQELALHDQARVILERHCADCHGAFGSNEGGFGDVLDFKTLIGTRVVPGRPEDSRLYQRMGILKNMPPPDGFTAEEMPTAEEIATIARWIESLEATASADSDCSTGEPGEAARQSSG